MELLVPKEGTLADVGRALKRKLSATLLKEEKERAEKRAQQLAVRKQREGSAGESKSPAEGDSKSAANGHSQGAAGAASMDTSDEPGAPALAPARTGSNLTLTGLAGTKRKARDDDDDDATSGEAEGDSTAKRQKREEKSDDSAMKDEELDLSDPGAAAKGQLTCVPVSRMLCDTVSARARFR